MALATPAPSPYPELAPRERPIPAPGGLQAALLRDGEQRIVALSYPLPRLASLDRLSDGEAAVALLALSGHSNAEIARVRTASVRTVANQLASAYRKLGGVSRARLCASDGGTVEAKGTKAALCGLLEAIYRPEFFEQVWLQSLADAARPLLDEGLGVAAWLVETSTGASSIRRVANAGMPTGTIDDLLRAAARAPAFLQAFHGRELCSLRGHLCARDTEALGGLRILRGCGMRGSST